MDIENIRQEYAKLNDELKDALSTMERSDKVIKVREEIKNLQKQCPHFEGFSLGENCPYCGKKFGE